MLEKETYLIKINIFKKRTFFSNSKMYLIRYAGYLHIFYFKHCYQFEYFKSVFLTLKECLHNLVLELGHY